MELSAIISAIGAFVTVGGLFLQWRKSRSEVRVLNSQEKSNLANAVDTASGTLVDALRYAAEERKAVAEERRDFEKRIDDLEAELERVREETEKRIEETVSHRQETDRKIETLNREYVAETSTLRAEVQVLRAQVAEGERKYAELEKKYSNSKEALELLLKANPDLTIPPGLELLLGDSVAGLKLKK